LRLLTFAISRQLSCDNHFGGETTP
jgi:hypothetical protein